MPFLLNAHSLELLRYLNKKSCFISFVTIADRFLAKGFFICPISVPCWIYYPFLVLFYFVKYNSQCFWILMTGERKEERGYSPFYDTFFRGSTASSENRLTSLPESQVCRGIRTQLSRTDRRPRWQLVDLSFKTRPKFYLSSLEMSWRKSSAR